MRTRTSSLVLLALGCFASNSLLCRAALGAGLLDPWTFTGVRLASGAIVLALILAARSRTSLAANPAAAAVTSWPSPSPSPSPSSAGSWLSAGALFGYAIAFSLAYVRIGAGPGALLLFGSVQVTMIGRSIHQGHWPRPREWAGLGLAFGGLVALLLPGARAPDLTGAALMLLAGVGWGAYSLHGRATTDPLATNASNFLRCAPLALACAAFGATLHPLQARGLLLAVASGALASGVGYSIWYAALPHLTRSRAAILQLAVPPLTAVAATLLLGEAPSLRLVLCGVAVLSGVALASFQR